MSRTLHVGGRGGAFASLSRPAPRPRAPHILTGTPAGCTGDAHAPVPAREPCPRFSRQAGRRPCGGAGAWLPDVTAAVCVSMPGEAGAREQGPGRIHRLRVLWGRTGHCCEAAPWTWGWGPGRAFSAGPGMGPLMAVSTRECLLRTRCGRWTSDMSRVGPAENTGPTDGAPAHACW